MAWRQSFNEAVLHDLQINQEKDERRLIRTFAEKRLNTIERNGRIISEQEETELQDGFLFFARIRKVFGKKLRNFINTRYVRIIILISKY